MAINLTNISEAYKTLTPEEKERRKAVAAAKMAEEQKKATESAKKTGSEIGGILGAIVGGIATESPQGAIKGYQAGKQVGGSVVGVARGDLSSVEGLMQGGASMPGLGGALGMEGSKKGSSISESMANSEQIKKIKDLYKSGVIDKAKYDSLMSYFSDAGSAAADGAAAGMELIGGSLSGM